MGYPLLLTVVLLFHTSFSNARGAGFFTAKHVEKRQAPQTGCGWSRAEAAVAVDESPVDASANLKFAKTAEFPWVVAVIDNKQRSKNDVFKGMSVGVVIHPSVVVTTAQTVTGARSITRANIIVRPCQDLARSQQCSDDRMVRKVVFHEEFQFETASNNIALLFLSQPLGANVGIACLANVALPDNTQAQYITWAKKRKQTKNENPMRLKKVTVTSKSRDECNAELRKSRFGSIFSMPSTLSCTFVADNSKQDGCDIDGTSPLVTNQDGRYTVYGLKAYHLGCTSVVATTYTPINQQIGWIDQKMQEESLDTSNYRV